MFLFPEVSRRWAEEPNIEVHTIHMEQGSWATGTGARVRRAWSETAQAWQPGRHGTWHPQYFAIV